MPSEAALKRCEPEIGALLARGVEAFGRAFASEPSAAAFAPGRINLIGDHTDYAEGFVMPMVFGWGTVAVLGVGQAERLRMHAADLGETVELALYRPIVPGEDVKIGSWSAMIAGVLEGVREQSSSAAVAARVTAGYRERLGLEASLVAMTAETGARALSLASVG